MDQLKRRLFLLTLLFLYTFQFLLLNNKPLLFSQETVPGRWGTTDTSDPSQLTWPENWYGAKNLRAQWFKILSSHPNNWKKEDHAKGEPPGNTYYLWRSDKPLPIGTKLLLEGDFPHCRMFDIQGCPPYDPKMPAMGDGSGIPEIPLLDEDIIPDPGSMNPFLPGADRQIKNRHFHITLEVKDGNPYELNQKSIVPPYRSPGNLRYVGSKCGKGGTRGTYLWLRLYIPDHYDPYGGVEPPILRIQYPGKQPVLAPICREIGTNLGGVLPYYNESENPALSNGFSVKELEAIEYLKKYAREGFQKAGTPGVIESGIHKIFTRPDHSVRLYKVFNTGYYIKWLSHFGDRNYCSQTLPDLYKKVYGMGAFEPPPGNDEHSSEHCLYNTYINTALNPGNGAVVVMKGKAPKTPRTLSGNSIMESSEEVRYWGFVLETGTPTRLTAVVSIIDEELILDKFGYYTIVISTRKNRPKNATEENGVTFREWPLGSTLSLSMRMMSTSKTTWTHAPQNLLWKDNPYCDPELVPNHLQDTMGEYYPHTFYQTKETFESNFTAAKKPYTVPSSLLLPRDGKSYEVAQCQMEASVNNQPFQIHVWYPSKGGQQPKGCCPLLLFAHGYGGNGTLQTTILKNILKMGFIVVAPDFPDQGIPIKPFNIENFSYRPPIVIETLRIMLSNPAFLIDSKKIGLIGHSLGGWSVLKPLLEGKITGAFVSYSMGELNFREGNRYFTEEELNKLSSPSLYFFGSEEDSANPNGAYAKFCFANSPGPSYLCEIPGSTHFTYIDSLPATTEQINLIVGNTVSFLNRYLFNARIPIQGSTEKLSSNTIITTKYGKVMGSEKNGCFAFLGIPYAKPPVGDKRWKAPEKPDPWQDIKQCTTFGFSSWQQKDPKIPISETSEDCLTLNIWIPKNNNKDLLPVMVWIHGGGFYTDSSSNPLYNGENISKQEVVFISINYRLGVLGFLSHPLLSKESKSQASGNYGILDQIQALRWIQENIQAFGGDPNQVTLFGQSAGGVSICALAVSPLANGLFQKAIIQSGTLITSLRERQNSIISLPSMEQIGEKLTQNLGLNGSNILTELRKIPPENLDKAWKKTLQELSTLEGSLGEGTRNHLIVDGYVLPDQPYLLWKKGQMNPKSVIVGMNAEEGSIFALNSAIKTKEQFLAYLKERFGSKYKDAVVLYPVNSDKDVFGQYSSLLTDNSLANTKRMCQMLEQNSIKTYMYYFSHVGSFDGSDVLGAFHGSEIPYLFGNLPRWGFKEQDYLVMYYMQSYFIQFAKTGNPNLSDHTKWDSYDTKQDNCLNLSIEPAMINNLRSEYCNLF